MKALATMALLLVASTVQAQTVYIKPVHRVPNSEHGCCGRVTLVTVAQHQGYKMPGYVQKLQAQPYGPLTQYNDGCPASRSHPCWSTLPELASDARKFGIRSEYRTGGSTELFGRGKPVIITYRPERRCEAGHIVAYVGGGQVYDPNFRHYQPVKWHLWRGDSLILK